MTRRIADRRHLYADPRGSIVLRDLGAFTSAAAEINTYDGSEAERAQRGQYGIPSSTNTGRFQYTGQVWLPELGLNYYKARIYSPTLGRFLQTDPIGYEDNVNLYGYVANDPVNLSDPTGMASMGGCGSRIEGVNNCSGSPYFAYEGALQAHRAETANVAPEGNSNPQGSPGSRSAPSSTGPQSSIPAPPEGLPGGPYAENPSSPGNRPGSFQGPKPESGPRPQAQWVPPESKGGPPGSKGYWKVQQPGERGWQWFDQRGRPITPQQAHPGSNQPKSQGIFRLENLRKLNPLHLVCYAVGICNPSPAN